MLLPSESCPAVFILFELIYVKYYQYIYQCTGEHCEVIVCGSRGFLLFNFRMRKTSNSHEQIGSFEYQK